MVVLEPKARWVSYVNHKGPYNIPDYVGFDGPGSLEGHNRSNTPRKAGKKIPFLTFSSVLAEEELV